MSRNIWDNPTLLSSAGLYSVCASLSARVGDYKYKLHAIASIFNSDTEFGRVVAAFNITGPIFVKANVETFIGDLKEWNLGVNTPEIVNSEGNPKANTSITSVSARLVPKARHVAVYYGYDDFMIVMPYLTALGASEFASAMGVRTTIKSVTHVVTSGEGDDQTAKVVTTNSLTTSIADSYMKHLAGLIPYINRQLKLEDVFQPNGNVRKDIQIKGKNYTAENVLKTYLTGKTFTKEFPKLATTLGITAEDDFPTLYPKLVAQFSSPGYFTGWGAPAAFKEKDKTTRAAFRQEDGSMKVTTALDNKIVRRRFWPSFNYAWMVAGHLPVSTSADGTVTIESVPKGFKAEGLANIFPSIVPHITQFQSATIKREKGKTPLITEANPGYVGPRQVKQKQVDLVKRMDAVPQTTTWSDTNASKFFNDTLQYIMGSNTK